MRRLLLATLFLSICFAAYAIDPQGSHLSDENPGSGSGLIIIVVIAIIAWMLYSAIAGHIERSKNAKEQAAHPTAQHNASSIKPRNTQNASSSKVSSAPTLKQSIRPNANVGNQGFYHAPRFYRQRPESLQDLITEIQNATPQKKGNGAIVYQPTKKQFLGGLKVGQNPVKNIFIEYTVDSVGDVKFTRWCEVKIGSPISENDWNVICHLPEPTEKYDGEYYDKCCWKIQNPSYTVYFNLPPV